jgi:ABC-type phosphate transport system substrate-binding protein
MRLRLLATALTLLTASAAAQGGAVVVGKTSNLMPMSSDDARRIFLGLQRNVGDQTITVIFQRDGGSREEFNTKVLGKTGSELTSYMAARIFAGRTVPPTDVGNDADVKRLIGNNPGAIGYVSDGAVDDSVRVLLHY